MEHEVRVMDSMRFDGDPAGSAPSDEEVLAALKLLGALAIVRPQPPNQVQVVEVKKDA